MKQNLLNIFIFFISIFGLTFFSNTVLAQENQDTLQIISPIPNEIIKQGNYTIRWKMSDNDQSTIKYSAQILDRLYCGNENFGDINEITTGLSSKTLENKIEWNGKSTNKTSELQDGKYCFKICGTFKNLTNEYAICKSNEIKIINKNKPPIFKSNLLNTQIKSGTYWEYDVSAEDPDKDKITYRMIQAPPFLNIDSERGTISTESGIWEIPAGKDKIEYEIEIGINDELNDEVTGNFFLTVVKNDGISSNKQSSIEIKTPNKSTIFFGKENEINIDIKDEEGIAEVTFQYSEDGKTWKTINTFKETSSSEFKYNWDVSEISDGPKVLRVNVLDKDQVLISKLSEEFKIQNSQPENEILISNFKPSNDEKIGNLKPNLEAQIIPGKNAEINSATLKVTLNSLDITSQCSIENNKIICKLINNLNTGKHSVTMEISDFENKKANASWNFSIQTISNSEDPNSISIIGLNIPRSALNVLFLLCGAVVLLLVVPWIFISTLRRRNKNTETSTTNEEFSDYTIDSSIPSDSSSYYSVPDITTNFYTPDQKTDTQTGTFDYSTLDNLANQPVNPPTFDNPSLNQDNKKLSDDEFAKLYPELASIPATDAAGGQSSSDAGQFVEPNSKD